MRHLFRTYTFYMRYACETCMFRIVSFWTVSECLRELDYEEMPDSDPVKILVA
jgi:hypothetical protein